MLSSPPPFPSLKHSPLVAKDAKQQENGASSQETEDSLVSIFRQVSLSSSSESVTPWPKGVLRNLSSDRAEYTTATDESTRDLSLAEHALKRSNPFVFSDDLSIDSLEITPTQEPFYIIQFKQDGKGEVLGNGQVLGNGPVLDDDDADDVLDRGEVLEPPQVVTTAAAAANNRKRCRSKDLVPEAKQMKTSVDKFNYKPAIKHDTTTTTTTSSWISAFSQLETFAEFMEALTPSMCASSNTKSMVGGSLTPWHSSSTMEMHYRPRHEMASSFHHKSYLATTVSTCRAF